jgi:hypothetical protein
MSGLLILALVVIVLAVIGAVAAEFGADSRPHSTNRYEETPGLA